MLDEANVNRQDENRQRRSLSASPTPSSFSGIKEEKEKKSCWQDD